MLVMILELSFKSCVDIFSFWQTIIDKTKSVATRATIISGSVTFLAVLQENKFDLFLHEQSNISNSTLSVNCLS